MIPSYDVLHFFLIPFGHFLLEIFVNGRHFGLRGYTLRDFEYQLMQDFILEFQFPTRFELSDHCVCNKQQISHLYFLRFDRAILN